MNNNFSDIFKEWEKINLITDKDQQKNKNILKSEKLKSVIKSYEIISIDLHGFNRYEAINKLKKFIIINQKKSSRTKVKIIHGVGRHSGDKRILKEAVIKWLKENKNLIYSYRPGLIGEGSSGVTVAIINQKL